MPLGSFDHRVRDMLEERLSVYLVADPELATGDFLHTVESALAGGVTAVQLRAKRHTDREILALARAVRERCLAAGALFFVNDRLDLALAAGADGVHLGVDDLPLPEARTIAGPGIIIGYSPETDEQVTQAAEAGADYLGVGPVFGTMSKADAGPRIGLGTIHRRSRLTTLPIIGIGGIGPREAGRVVAAGAVGVAVAGAIMRAGSPQDVAQQIREAVFQAKATPPAPLSVPRLMLVTDHAQSALPLPELVSRSLDAGVDIVQIREKQASSSERAEIVEALLEAGVEPSAISINDDVDVALRYGIGLHLPERSATPLEARGLLGPQALIGRSVHSPAEAARSEGAGYLIAGHVFPTPSKAGLEPLGLDGLRRIVEASPVPVLAIGGITADRVADVINAGAAGVAVMSAISASRQPESVARAIRLALDEALRGADTWNPQQQ